MDIRSSVENEKYLFCFGSPFKSVCKVLSLKSGILIIAIFDIIFGVYYFINLMIELWQVFPWGLTNILILAMLLQRSLGIAAIFFAIQHIRALSNDFAVYSNFKTFELVAQSFLKFILIFSLAKYLFQIYGAYFLLYFVIMIIERLLAILFAKIVWSAKIRVIYNENALVLHGEESARKIQVQSNNLVAPEIVFSGTNPYFPGP